LIQIIALNVQKINISEKGTLLSTNTTGRLIPSLTSRLTTGLSKNIQSQLKPIYDRTVPRTICLKLDKCKSHFFETIQLLAFVKLCK
jgi:hypothetical protein